MKIEKIIDQKSLLAIRLNRWKPGPTAPLDEQVLWERMVLAVGKTLFPDRADSSVEMEAYKAWEYLVWEGPEW